MTTEEFNQYNSLSENDKSLYQRVKSMHPEWSHKQIMMKIALDHAVESHLVSGGPIGGDVIDDESLWDKIKNIFR